MANLDPTYEQLQKENRELWALLKEISLNLNSDDWTTNDFMDWLIYQLHEKCPFDTESSDDA